MVEEAKDRDIRQSDGKLTLISASSVSSLSTSVGGGLSLIYFVNQDVIGSIFSAMNFGCKK